MKTINLLLPAITLLFIIGCSPLNNAKDFSYGLRQISMIDSKYNSTMGKYPGSLAQIDAMIKDYVDLKGIHLDKEQEQFSYVVEYKTLSLQSERLRILGDKYANSGSTKEGFACKLRPLIVESAMLRNQSAHKGYGATRVMNEFIDKYKNYAESAGLFARDVLFLNATYYQFAKDAKKDSGIINNFCPWNVTLGFYREEFGKETNLSKEFIKNVGYDDAVVIWKKLKGIG